MTAVEKLKSLADAALNFFYPPVCHLCTQNRASAGEGYVCPECWRDVRVRLGAKDRRIAPAQHGERQLGARDLTAR